MSSMHQLVGRLATTRVIEAAMSSTRCVIWLKAPRSGHEHLVTSRPRRGGRKLINGRTRSLSQR